MDDLRFAYEEDIVDDGKTYDDIDEDKLAERVQEGALLLDRELPGWYTKVNPDTLQMSSCTKCVLGQLYGSDNTVGTGFDIGQEFLFGEDAEFTDQAEKFGFDAECGEYEQLRGRWKHEIGLRRHG